MSHKAAERSRAERRAPMFNKSGCVPILHSLQNRPER